MKTLKRALSLVLTFVICVISIDVRAFATETETNSKENLYDFEVNYSVVNSWNTSKQIQVEVKNTGNEKIEQWALKYEIDGEISQIWNAVIYDADKGIIDNATYNADIYPGQSVTFGYIVDNNTKTPDRFEMVQTRVLKADGYEVILHPDYYYGNRFNGTVYINNTSDKPIKNWELEADASFEFSSVWNANVLEKNGNHYLFEGNSNTVIPAYGTVSFGFCGAFEDLTKLSNIKLTHMVIDDGKETPVIDNPDDDDPDIDNPDDNPDIDNPGEEHGEQINEDEFGGLTWDQMQDTDGDGLPDEYENDHELDPKNPDTDGDELPDGFEVLKASSNPLDKYTLGNGVIDSMLDPDEDGLTLLEEYKNDTNPLEADSDNDGLNDGDEVKVYNTDPCNPDTDGDGVNDGLEIEVGLDPNNPQTFGYSDSEYQFSVKLTDDSQKMSAINNNNSDYKMSISIEGSGNLNKDLYVRESAYAYTMESEFSLGMIPEVLYKGEGSIDSVTVNFAISEANIYESYAADSLDGINRYNIFYFDEEENILVPLATNHDESTNTISATANKAGTFVVVDMEKWFANLGYDVTDEYAEETVIIEDNVYESERELELQELIPDDGQEDDTEADVLEDEAEADEQEEEITEPEADVVMEADVDMIIEQEPESGDPSVDSGYIAAQEESTTARPRMKLMAAPATKAAAPAAIPEFIDPGTTTVDLAFCINTNIHPINDTEFEAMKENIRLIGRTVFNNSKMARIYVLDQNGNIVKTNSNMDYALTEQGLVDMLVKVNNAEPTEGHLTKQLNGAATGIPYRDGSYRAAFIFGSNWLDGNSNSARSELVKNSVRVSICEPNMMPGCWYEETAKMTKGIQIFSYMDFYDEVIDFMYGKSVVGDTTYNMITSTGLKKIALKSRLNSHNPEDTDSDGLKDWDEVDTTKITVNGDGSAILPTYYDYLNNSWYHEYLNWKSQYRNLYDRNGKTVDEMLKSIYVLPVISDPTMKDTDGDMIGDKAEVTAKVLDSRYASLNPKKKDTIELLYPELSDTSINNSKNPSYVTVNNNDVVMHLKVIFEGDKDVKANSVLDTAVTDADVIAENNKIYGRIGTDPTLKELAKDGITSRWNSYFYGSEYDFCDGLPVQFTVDIIEDSPRWFTNSITMEFKTGVCGRSNQAGVDWNTGCNRYVTLYNNCCDIASHKNLVNPGCSDYASTLYSVAVFAGTCAHEFGHVMGIKDLYASATVNNGYTIVSNSEVTYLSRGYFSLPQAGCMMMRNGHGTENDVEMVILAFCENKWQYYVPSGTTQVMSKAIKSPVVFTDGKKNYTWDKVNHVFK